MYFRCRLVYWKVNLCIFCEFLCIFANSVLFCTFMNKLVLKCIFCFHAYFSNNLHFFGFFVFAFLLWLNERISVLNRKKSHLQVRCCYEGCFRRYMENIEITALQNHFLVEFCSSSWKFPKSLPWNVWDPQLSRKSSWTIPTNMLCCSLTRWTT